MSPLLQCIEDARGEAARERAELVARIGADLARLDLLDRLAAPCGQLLADSGRNPLALSLHLGRAAAPLPTPGGSRLRRLASRLLTAGG